MSQIIVVDDDPLTLSLLDSILSSDDHRVVVARSGEEFLALAKKLDLKDVQAVVLDMMMPGIDGLEALSQFRKQSGGANIPVIMLTGRDDPDTVKAAYDLGISCFLSKPFSKQQLFHAIELSQLEQKNRN
jgi:two-component system, sensor histidine kinase ChiS